VFGKINLYSHRALRKWYKNQNLNKFIIEEKIVLCLVNHLVWYAYYAGENIVSITNNNLYLDPCIQQLGILLQDQLTKYLVRFTANLIFFKWYIFLFYFDNLKQYFLKTLIFTLIQCFSSIYYKHLTRPLVYCPLLGVYCWFALLNFKCL